MMARILLLILLTVSACDALSQPAPTVTPVPTSTATATVIPSPTASPAEATVIPSITPTAEIQAEDLVGEGIVPPLDITLPEGWGARNLTVALPDIDSALRFVYLTAYEGPVSGGTGSIVLLWGFPNFFSGSFVTLPGTPTPSPDLWVDGLRLFRIAMVDVGCNPGTDLQRDYRIGELTGTGTQFAIIDCPESPDTRGWFVGVQEQGINFVFFVYADPIEAMDLADTELQAILDSVRFRIGDFTTGE
jgi:hypothetical protein